LIYLDHHAATPTCAAAREAMADAEADGWANPASVHAAGRGSRALLERARDRVATALGAEPSDVVFTSGGTEAVSLGVLGLGRRRTAIVTTRVEHPSVAAAADRLEAGGTHVIRLPALGGRAARVAEVRSALGPDALLAVQWVNHETGARWPIEAWTEVAREARALVLVDATQALGKIPVDVAALDADAVAVASHKMGGPSGAGALWVRRGVDIDPLLVGGAQERGRRPGTPDVVAVAGFGGACAAVESRCAAMARIEALRDELERCLVELGGVINGDTERRVPTVTNASFRGWRGEHLVAALDLEGVCVSTGAACSSGKSEPSPVLLAMYPDEPWRAAAALRLSLGPETSRDDVAGATAAVRRVLSRAHSPNDFE
jgi:cysteine desulfurase